MACGGKKKGGKPKNNRSLPVVFRRFNSRI